ncbi:hypothetical protein HRG_002249 [Hirsutella rhossiliensis]|uniref:Uncharacterized protein n=1 Tax=Hirsutella rhossiliensis TaxID=111463 RepID=A0A9P8N4L9_9HYPO|nr:uncharacterized protein HRG_02249 [Hirsutella rhossiliensis]KAH0966840.1 hypothetical protein HRG_02249 [Hirsutella rhossiliensis]
MPYAWLAEAIDNRKLLLAGFISSTVSVVYFFGICRLPVGIVRLELVVCFRVLECIGGGTTMAYILLYSSLARKNPVESRTLVIYIAGAVLLLARAGAMVLVGLLLQGNAPSIGPITILVYLTNIPVLLSGGSSRPAIAMGQGQSLCGDAADADGGVAPLDAADAASDVSSVTGLDLDGPGGDDDGSVYIEPPSRKGILLHIKHILLTAYNEYLGRAVLRTGLFVCATKIVALDVQFIQPQWSVKKFDWNFTATSYVNAYATLICMVVLVCLPFLSASLSDRLDSPQRTDILIFRLSLFFRIAGTVAMGLAPTKLSFLAAVGVQALSAGAYDAFKSLVTSFSSAAHVTELYAVISLIETLAHMLSCQLWASLLVLSLGLDRSRMGLPFWVSGFLSLLALATFQVMVSQATEFLAPRCIE